jgi:hypothetical protein
MFIPEPDPGSDHPDLDFFPIPDTGSRGQKAPDPGSESTKMLLATKK